MHARMTSAHVSLAVLEVSSDFLRVTGPDGESIVSLANMHAA